MNLGHILKSVASIGLPAAAGALIGGPTGAVIGGQVGAGILGAEGQEDANKANIASAREQMAFQERMSSTAHQREVTDLEKAGLNPVLSANSGESTPVGAMATSQNVMSGLAPAISSAVQTMATAASVKNLVAQARDTNADAALKEAKVPYAKDTYSFGKDILGLFDYLHPLFSSARERNIGAVDTIKGASAREILSQPFNESQYERGSRRFRSLNQNTFYAN